MTNFILILAMLALGCAKDKGRKAVSDCDNVRGQLRTEEAKIAVCTSASECTFGNGIVKDGCFIVYNKSADRTRYDSLAETYNAKECHGGVVTFRLDCAQVSDTDIKCHEGKCAYQPVL